MEGDYWAIISSLSDENGILQHSLHPVNDRATLLLSATRTLDRNNHESELGWIQLLQNEEQQFSTTRNANNVARVKSSVKQSLKCQHRHRKHVECQPAGMKKDEQAVQDLMACIKDFAEPLDTSLQSGLGASPVGA